jgi:hypothetical protein
MDNVVRKTRSTGTYPLARGSRRCSRPRRAGRGYAICAAHPGHPEPIVDHDERTETVHRYERAGR